jgi:hypothetical protein
MFHVDTPSGRLIVARWSDFRSTEEAEAFRDAIKAAVVKVKPGVICADWRRATVVSPGVAVVMSGMLRAANPMLTRSAILLGEEHATFNLQTERLVREAGNPNRRTFRSAEEMLAWLAEVLLRTEHDAARRFLLEDEPAPGSAPRPGPTRRAAS